MRIYQADNVNKLFEELCFDIEFNSVIKQQLQGNTMDLGICHIELTNIDNNKVTHPVRKLSEHYCQAEMEWYLSGSLKALDIKYGQTIWGSLADENGNIQSNYGHFVFYQKMLKYDMSQFDWCVFSLKENPNSRQAVINYNQPLHKKIGIKDFPCTIFQQFMINNGKLDSYVCMRSNDLIYGFCYDILWFTFIQKQLAEKLKIPCGKYIHTAVSMHAYERHYDMIKQVNRFNGDKPWYTTTSRLDN